MGDPIISIIKDGQFSLRLDKKDSTIYYHDGSTPPKKAIIELACPNTRRYNLSGVRDAQELFRLFSDSQGKTVINSRHLGNHLVIDVIDEKNDELG